MSTDKINRVVAVGTATLVVLLGSACGPEEERMTPEEARDSLTTIAHDTAELLGISGWAEMSAPRAKSCDSGAGVKWSYLYGAPIPDADRLADVQKVADYWASLGMEVRTNAEHDPVVFGAGGPVQSISFSTGPSVYDVSGTSLCVPGDANDWR